MDNGPTVNQLIKHWNEKCKPQKIEGEFKASADDFYEHSDFEESVGEVI